MFKNVKITIFRVFSWFFMIFHKMEAYMPVVKKWHNVKNDEKMMIFDEKSIFSHFRHFSDPWRKWSIFNIWGQKYRARPVVHNVTLKCHLVSLKCQLITDHIFIKIDENRCFFMKNRVFDDFWSISRPYGGYSRVAWFWDLFENGPKYD